MSSALSKLSIAQLVAMIVGLEQQLAAEEARAEIRDRELTRLREKANEIRKFRRRRLQ